MNEDSPKDNQRAQISIPIQQQLSKYVWVKGLNNYKTNIQTTNASGIFLPGSRQSKSKYTFGSTVYSEELDIERLYLFMGYETWFINPAVVPYVEFTRLSLKTSSDGSDTSNSSATVMESDEVENDEEDDDSEVSDGDNWDFMDEDTSAIEIEPVHVDVSVAEKVREMKADQDRIAYQKLIHPKQFRDSVITNNYHPPGRIFQSVCIDDRNNDVYVYGGFSAGRTPCSLISKFTLKGDKLHVEDITSRFKLVALTEANDKLGLTPFREGHTAIIRKGKMYVLAGNAQRSGTFEKELLEFDLETGDIKPYPTISRGKDFTPRAYHNVAYISKRDVLVVYGGKMKPGLQSGVSNDLFIFHFQTHTWENIEMNFVFPPLSGHSMFKINGDNVGIIGGVSKPYSEETEDLNTNLYVYNLEYNTFTSLDLGPYGFEGRYSMPVAFSESNQILTVGAGNITNRYTDFSIIYFETVEVYSEHFSKPLLLNAFNDLLITCSE